MEKVFAVVSTIAIAILLGCCFLWFYPHEEVPQCYDPERGASIEKTYDLLLFGNLVTNFSMTKTEYLLYCAPRREE